MTVVGICAAIEHVRWGPWDLDAAMSPRTYATAVQAAGALAVVLPPDDTVLDAPDRLLDRIDALLLAGGSDLDPASYGAEPHPQTTGFRAERDRFELSLGFRALERDMPVLGICRGMQMLNVICGGTLNQHVDRLDLHRHTPGVFGDHDVRLEAGSLAARAAGAERLAVRSHHHQGIGELGDGLTATGWAEADDLIEAIEVTGRAFALGVLWHPEEDVRSRVIGALVEAAK